MTSGGRRNRNGAIPDPESARSDKRGYKLTALPSGGYGGPVPEWPLSIDADLENHDRELAVWESLWRTPQACAWSMPSESWRVRTVAMYCRVLVRCEAPDAGAALLGQLHRFADQIGMTTAGLSEMGWQIAVDETAIKREDRAAKAENPPTRKSSRDRLKVVGGN